MSDLTRFTVILSDRQYPKYTYPVYFGIHLQIFLSEKKNLKLIFAEVRTETFSDLT